MAESTTKPNVLFLFTDDQRFDTIAALNGGRIHTPNMDRLAARGTAFTHAYIPGGTCPAVCMPSRAMLHTGRTLFGIDGCGEGIPADHVTLGEHLGKCGYHTFATGKWHNGRSAYARSFADGGEIFFGGMADHWNVPAYHFDPTGRYDSRIPRCVDPARSKELEMLPADHVTAGKHSSELLADATIDFLRRYDRAEPFFAYVSFLAPHDPRTMPQRFQRMYDPQRIALPENFLGGHPFDNGALKIRDELLADFPRDGDEIRSHIADYYAMISHLDHEIGRILDALAERADDTIVVLAGDNGLAVGQHGLMGKQSLYEHSVRVPLVFCGPGVPRGLRTDAFCYLLDVYPTLCELAGVAAPDSVEGRSLAPAMRDPAAGARESLFLAYMGYQRAVRERRHKLIEYHVNGRRTTQLFDLEADPTEQRNLADEGGMAATVSRLHEKLRSLADDWKDGQTKWGEEFWGRE